MQRSPGQATEREFFRPERLLAFSDGVFGVAITLLVIDLRLPVPSPGGGEHDLLPRLTELEPNLLVFAFTFVVIGLSWMGHHRKFTLVERIDSAVLWINLLFLMALCLVPFASSVLSEYSRNRFAFALYTGVMASLDLLSAALSLYTLRAPFLQPENLAPRGRRHDIILSPLLKPVIFVASAARHGIFRGTLIPALKQGRGRLTTASQPALPPAAPPARLPGDGEPPMDLRFTPEETAFRDEVRAFIRDNLPADIRERMRLGHPPRKQDTVTWQRILNKKGWACPHWPVEYGGPGWSPVQRMIFIEENQAAPAPELLSFNITMIGPVLIQFGTDEQKRRFLDRARNLDDWWCQGFSEPGAGSDLASLKTRAERHGDHYIVNGSKIWTSTAHNADWCFLLVRTNPHAAKRQEGISFLLVDIKTPGITVRPIISIDGSHHLNEVFFDDVKIPIDNRIHEENRGWDVAKYLLGNERTGIARIGRSRERLNTAKEHAREARFNGRPLIEDAAFRQRIAQLEVDMTALQITQYRVVSAYAKQHDGRPDPLSSVLKVKGTELLQATSELAMDVAGPLAMPFWAQELAALSNEPDLDAEWAGESAASYLMLRAASIYGGTNEIQKNILTKAVLRL